MVAYNPSLATLRANVEIMTKQTPNLVIVNNGSAISGMDYVVNLDHNFGIAYAQNYGANLLHDQGIDYIFFLDQDSIFESDFFKKMLIQWQMLTDTNKNLALLSPTMINKKTGEPFSVLMINQGRLERKYQSIDQLSLLSKTLPISSGILISCDAFLSVEGNNEDLFIDWVDFDLDLKLVQKGYLIQTTPLVKLYHQIGTPVIKHFFGKSIHVNNYVLFREFYYVRNAIFIEKNYGKNVRGLSKYVRKEIVLRIISAFYEPDFFSRIRIIIYGISKGKKSDFSTNFIKKD